MDKKNDQLILVGRNFVQKYRFFLRILKHTYLKLLNWPRIQIIPGLSYCCIPDFGYKYYDF